MLILASMAGLDGSRYHKPGLQDTEQAFPSSSPVPNELKEYNY